MGACACHSVVKGKAFCENASILMKNFSSAMLKLHDGIAVLYMPQLKPVSQSSKPILRTYKNMP